MQGRTITEVQILRDHNQEPGSIAQPNMPFNERICFGCGEKGHGIPTCPPVNKLISEGKVQHSARGQIIRPDGRSIRRLPEGSILEAFTREEKVPVTHFIKVNNEDTSSYSKCKENQESRSAYIEDYVSSDTEDFDSDNSSDGNELSDEKETETDDEAYAFPVERVTRNSTQGRQERFKEVFPPGQSKTTRKTNEKDKGKERVPTIPAKKAEAQAKPKSTQPTPVTKTKPVNKREVGQSQEKSWDSDDIIMDDVDDKKATEKRTKYNDSPFKPTLNPDRKNTTTRQRVSDIAAKIKPYILKLLRSFKHDIR
jgi:hypothetical protein